MHKRQRIEGAENHVHLPTDTPQEWGHREADSAVPSPIRGRGQRNGFGADAGGEDFGGVDPAGRAPGHGEDGDEEVGEGDDDAGDEGMGGGDPRDGVEVGVGVWVGLTVEGFKGADNKEAGHLAESPNEQGAPATPLQDVLISIRFKSSSPKRKWSEYSRNMSIGS